MKKKIVHQSFKLTPHHSKINLPIILTVIVAVCLIVGGYLYSTMEKTSINMIAPPSMPRSNPELTAPSDCAVVSKLALADNCGNNSFQSMTYSCGKNGPSKTQGGAGSCKPYTMWYEYAATDCKNTCVKVSPSTTPANCTYQQVKCFKAPCPKILVCSTPTPLPSPSPIVSQTPNPSPIPSIPVGMCISTVKNIVFGSRVAACVGSEAQSASYTCVDGYSGQLGDNTTCRSEAEYNSLAQSRCASPHSCIKK